MKFIFYGVSCLSLLGLCYVLFFLPIVPVSLLGARGVTGMPQESTLLEARYQMFRAVHFRVVVVATSALIGLSFVGFLAARKYV